MVVDGYDDGNPHLTPPRQRPGTRCPAPCAPRKSRTGGTSTISASGRAACNCGWATSCTQAWLSEYCRSNTARAGILISERALFRASATARTAADHAHPPYPLRIGADHRFELEEIGKQAIGPRHPTTGQQISQGIDKDVFAAGHDPFPGPGLDRSRIGGALGQAAGEQGDQLQPLEAAPVS